MSKLYKYRIIFILVLVFPLLFSSSDNIKTDEKEISKVLKELQKEKEYLKHWEKELNNKEQMLTQWEQSLNDKAKELKKEKNKLKNEWKNLEEARKSKKVDSRILGFFNSVEPSMAVGYLIDYYNKDKKMFYSIMLGVKKGVRTSFLEELSIKHKEMVLDYLEFLSKQNGYKDKISKSDKNKQRGRK